MPGTLVTNGIDISNWQGAITPAEMQSVKDRYNLSFITCGIWDPMIAQIQLDAASAVGLTDRGVYVFLGLDADNHARTQQGIDLATKNGLTRIAMDAERSDLDGTRPTWEQILDCALQLDAAGFRPTLYMGPAVYDEYGQPPIPEHWDVWLGNYVYKTAVPASEWSTKAPSGMDFVNPPDWMGPAARKLLARASVWQWQGTTDLGEFSADLNVRIEPGRDSVSLPMPASTDAPPLETPQDVPPPPVNVSQDPNSNGSNDVPPPTTPLPDGNPDPRVWIFQLHDEHGFRALALNGAVIEFYNGPEMPVLRIGSTDGEYPGQLSKLFGTEYVWLTAKLGDGAQPAYWVPAEGD